MCAVSVFDLTELTKRIAFLEAELNKPEVYSNVAVSTAYNKELKHKSDEFSLYNELKGELEFLEMCLSDTTETDVDMVAEINNNIAKLEEKISKKKRMALLSIALIIVLAIISFLCLTVFN